MADADKPSLTPHRDAVEKAIASFAEARKSYNEATRLNAAIVDAVTLAIADARDRGATVAGILKFSPTLVHNAAEAICNHFAMDDMDGAVRSLLLAAQSPLKPSRSVAAEIEIEQQHTGGRA